ncbi:MAG: alpha/beta hydrolase, partial [Thermoguttaceae bacterium]|nr:alpha/beta hydrolase [Thermoguttaceae bacterium]MBP3694095.1 alpha/beta hydrolase [Thermoguttaceae bacterium]
MTARIRFSFLPIISSLTVLFILFAFHGPELCVGEQIPIWPEGKIPNFQDHQTIPTYEICIPSEKKSTACVIVFPGGAYRKCCDQHEGVRVAQYFNQKGVTAVIVRYRVGRPKDAAKHLSAWQDAQRTVRLVRSRAAELGIDQEKIGCLGFSAGGHLTLMAAAASQTPAYAPIDELDQVSCCVNFAIPVYPAYVLQECSDRPYSGTGENMEMAADFPFDTQTPPMCLIHGDADSVPSWGSLAVYRKLRTMNIPAEMHIYAKAGHGFGAMKGGDHLSAWMDRVHEWMEKMKF